MLPPLEGWSKDSAKARKRQFQRRNSNDKPAFPRLASQPFHSQHSSKGKGVDAPPQTPQTPFPRSKRHADAPGRVNPCQQDTLAPPRCLGRVFSARTGQLPARRPCPALMPWASFPLGRINPCQQSPSPVPAGLNTVIIHLTDLANRCKRQRYDNRA